MPSKSNILALLFTILFSASNGQSYEIYRDNGALETTEKPRYPMLCMDIKPQHSMDINYIKGTWYGSEIIMHTVDIPGVFNYENCVVININDITDQMQATNNFMRGSQTQSTHYYQHSQQHSDPHDITSDPMMDNIKYLRLVWSEKDSNLEYTFNFTEHNPGLWFNMGDQRGSLALNQYTQFSGTVQVAKAVNNQLVLTFCGNSAKSTIYSIVLSKNQIGLTSEELISIRKLLFRRGLTTETIRKLCVSSAASLKTATAFSVLLGLLMICRKFF